MKVWSLQLGIAEANLHLFDIFQQLPFTYFFTIHVTHYKKYWIVTKGIKWNSIEYMLLYQGESSINHWQIGWAHIVVMFCLFWNFTCPFPESVCLPDLVRMTHCFERWVNWAMGQAWVNDTRPVIWKEQKLLSWPTQPCSLHVWTFTACWALPCYSLRHQSSEKTFLMTIKRSRRRGECV